MIRKFCDLHTHSNHSDGTFTPAELIKEAEERELYAIALTDHNTVTGLHEFLKAAKNSSVKAIPGIEISTAFEGTELHIVGLFIAPEHYRKVTAFTDRINENKRISNIKLVDALQKDGYDIDYKTLISRLPDGKYIFNRAHVAAELTEKGYVSSIAEAFETLLSKDGKYYCEPQRLSSLEAISFLKSINSTVILAHPFLNFNEAQLRSFLPYAKGCGLDGIETLYSYPENAEELWKLSAQIAQEFNLKQSGGSDFHGTRKPHISLGIGAGNLAVPSEFALQLNSTR